MNSRLLPKENTERKSFLVKGTLSLEAAVCMPVVIFLLCFLIYILQAAAAYTRINKAVCRTCETMGAYATLYYHHGIEEFEDFILSEIGDLNLNIPGGNEITESLSYFFSIRKIAAKGEELLYGQAAWALFQNYYENEKSFVQDFTEIENPDMSGSSFFDDGHSIVIKVTATVKPLIKLPDFFPEIRISASQKVRAWLYGEEHSYVTAEQNIWEMDNLTRGKVIKKKYGGNLSEFYPVISIYEDGNITMIKSIDHTKDTYSDGRELYSKIRGFAEQLDAFNGTDNVKYASYTPVIKEKDIKSKKILLVMPSNEMNSRQSTAIMNACVYAESMGIKVELKLLGVSPG